MLFLLSRDHGRPAQALKMSIWIEDSNHVAELGFILLLAITASKAVGVIIDGKPLGLSAASAATERRRVT